MRPAGRAAAFVAFYNNRDWDGMRGLLASDCIYREITKPERRIEGGDEVVAHFRAWAKAAPDPRGEVVNTVATDGAVAIEVEWEATTPGPFGDFSSVAKAPVACGAFFFVFDGESVKEFRHYFDSLAMFQILGIRS